MKTFNALVLLALTLPAFAVTAPTRAPLDDMEKIRRFEAAFHTDSADPKAQQKLKLMCFSLKQKSVPTLIKVMKEPNFTDKGRWHATMLLGQVMGKKSAPFIAKFSSHPSWMMRVASLKALAALGMKDYQAVYAKALKDESLIVRVQALDNITRMDLKPLAPQVWSMMYDQSNYTGKAGQRRRTSIVRSIIRTVGDLKYAKAQGPLNKLMQKPKYQDLLEDLDYSLEKISGKNSPTGNAASTRAFWASAKI